MNAFYPTHEPTCYIFGDVIFSPNAIEAIVETETKDVMLFGSKPPFAANYPKPWIEPFAFKVNDTDHFQESIEKVKQIDKAGGFNRKPIAWELWNVICGGNPNIINETYMAINDYTCDIDKPEEIEIVKRMIENESKRI